MEGANVAAYRGIDGETVLHRVKDRHDDAFIQVLLAAGAPVDVASERGETPLHFRPSWPGGLAPIRQAVALHRSRQAR